MRLAASREVRDHRRRILDHQERMEATPRTPAAEAADPQLKIPLVGEVRRPKLSPPPRRRPRTKKPVQPQLGET